MRGVAFATERKWQEAVHEGTGGNRFPNLRHPLGDLYPLDFRMSLEKRLAYGTVRCSLTHVGFPGSIGL